MTRFVNESSNFKNAPVGRNEVASVMTCTVSFATETFTLAALFLNKDLRNLEALGTLQELLKELSELDIYKINRNHSCGCSLF